MHAPRLFHLSLIWLVLAGLAACGENDAAGPSSLTLTSAKTELDAGDTIDITATYDAATTGSPAGDATWTTSDAAIATVAAGADGHATVRGVSAGSASIKATGAGGVVGELTVVVHAATLRSVAITPAQPSLALGTQVQLALNGTYSDGAVHAITAQITWASSAATTAQVNPTGLVHAAALGTATITATVDTFHATVTVTVTDATLTSIAVAPADPTLTVAAKQQLTATGTFSDGSEQNLATMVTWTSAAPAIATVTPGGLATAVAVGTTQVTATLGAISGSTTLTVTAATLVSIALEPTAPSVPVGRTLAMVAKGTYSDTTIVDITAQVTWQSSAIAIASVDGSSGHNGEVTGRSQGTATISATLNGVVGTIGLTVTAPVIESIAITPAAAQIVPGGTQQYVATATLGDGTTQVVTALATWVSVDPAIATVSSAGLATGVAVGTTTLRATLQSITGEAPLVVLGPAVSRIQPDDGRTGIRANAPIAVTFNQAINPATLTVQSASGACTGSLQLSSDHFATCIGFAAPTISAAAVTATPAAPLTPLTTYQVRVAGTITSTAGVAIGADTTQPTGFTIVAAGSCATNLVISQIFGGGGNVFRSDFIELHNAGSTPINLAGYAVQYASLTATTWTAQALPSAIVPAGGYFLIQEASTGTTPELPDPDFVPATGISMSSTFGKVALTPFTTALSGACAVTLPATIDMIGYGPSTNCFEGTATAALTNLTGATRNNDGCTDAGANATDFTLGTPVPRNGTTTPKVCTCSN